MGQPAKLYGYRLSLIHILLQALVLYLIHEAPEHEQNLPMVMEMLQAAEVKEDDEDYESPLDLSLIHI